MPCEGPQCEALSGRSTRDGITAYVVRRTTPSRSNYAHILNSPPLAEAVQSLHAHCTALRVPAPSAAPPFTHRGPGDPRLGRPRPPLTRPHPSTPIPTRLSSSSKRRSSRAPGAALAARTISKSLTPGISPRSPPKASSSFKARTSRRARSTTSALSIQYSVRVDRVSHAGFVKELRKRLRA